MATREEVQEIANRGLQDQLPPEKRELFNELVRRGVITLPTQPVASAPTQAPPGQPAPTQPDFPGASVIEPLATIATGLPSQIGAGVAGAITAPFGGAEAATENIRAIQEAGTFQPRTAAGQKGLETVGDLIQSGIDIVNFPISGLAGLAEIVTGQGIGKAAETVQAVQEGGVAKTLGERTFEETGSPLAASIAETAPEAALLGLPLKATPKRPSRIAPERVKEIGNILETGRQMGVDVLTSDIFPPQAIFPRLLQQFSERVPGVGTGGKRAVQKKQRIDAIAELNRAVPRNTSEEIFQSLELTRDKFKNAAGKRLRTFIDDLTPQGKVPTPNTVKSINDAVRKLTRVGKVPNKPLINTLETLKNTAINAGDDFELLRAFRTDARVAANLVDPGGRSLLRSSDKVLVDNIVNSATKDLDSFVSLNSTPQNLRRYKQADEVYRREAIKLTKSRLKNVVDKGEVSPEKIGNLLFSSTPSEVKLLFNNLDASGRANSRLSLYRKALDASTDGVISPQKFVKQIDKLKDNFDVFFRGDAKAELEGIKKLMESTQRAAESGIVTPTGQSTLFASGVALGGGVLAGNPAALLTTILGATAAAGSRVFESSGVRNLLIRLGKSSRRGTLEADLLKTIPVVLAEANRTIEQQNNIQNNVEPQLTR